MNIVFMIMCVYFIGLYLITLFSQWAVVILTFYMMLLGSRMHRQHALREIREMSLKEQSNMV